MNKINRLKAQTISEYSFFIAIAFITILTMNVYVKRGLQGRYADGVDLTTRYISAKIGKGISQYEPYYEQSASTINSPRLISEEVKNEGWITRILSATSTNVKGNSVEGTNVELDDPIF
ncbi:MAG: hypothetical protein NTW64_01965 [Candidatus Omnitrophica bacterium]|nr:hypothetical protein [Candidatus Omnitrophota bacterium]